MPRSPPSASGSDSLTFYCICIAAFQASLTPLFTVAVRSFRLALAAHTLLASPPFNAHAPFHSFDPSALRANLLFGVHAPEQMRHDRLVEAFVARVAVKVRRRGVAMLEVRALGSGLVHSQRRRTAYKE